MPPQGWRAWRSGSTSPASCSWWSSLSLPSSWARSSRWPSCPCTAVAVRGQSYGHSHQHQQASLLAG
eukprot:13844445-Alexandrium_andersonii.AAC.1